MIVVCVLVIIAAIVAVGVGVRYKTFTRLFDRSNVESQEDSSTVVNGKIDGHDTVGEYGMTQGQSAQAGALELCVTKAAPGPADSAGNATTAITVTVHNSQDSAAQIEPSAWSALDRANGDVPQANIADKPTPVLPIAGQASATLTLYFESTDIGRVVYSADDAAATQLSWHIPQAQ
ncbi:MAG: hypothetical protein FWD65_05725 [Coriobacteriia bacterium]|nr:hypothetical protein [Coriobacteriia bacterium]